MQNLSLREKPLVVKLPRQSGSRESRFAHLLSGDIDLEELAAASERAETPAPVSRGGNDRIAKLEDQVATLTQELNDLKQQFAEFRKQFE